MNNFTKRFGAFLRTLYPKPYTLNPIPAFGLIEVLVSGMVLVTVIGASVSVRQRAGAEAAFARHQSEAYMLAQEGVEAVHQIRDTNYLAKQKTLATDPFTKRPWTCGLTTSTSFGTDLIGAYQSCGANIFNTANIEGDFSPTLVAGHPSSYKSLELSTGMPAGNIFRDDASGAVLNLPTWSLSSPGSPPAVPSFDAGSNAAQAALNQNMRADNCIGAERMFVHEGTLVAGGNDVRLNRRTGDADFYNPEPARNENYPGNGILGVAGNYCDTNVPSGYFEFKRQVYVTPRRNASGGVGVANNTNEVAGNLPAAWNVAATDISTHEAQVLVRVSWNESNRASGVNDENSVLLATYLTDWRPSN